MYILINLLKRRFIAPFLCLLLVVFSIQSVAFADEVFVSAYSRTFSDTLTIKDTEDGWKGDSYQPGESQWTYNWFEAGVTYSGFTLSYIYRLEYDLRFSEDAAELVYLVTNKKDLPVGKSYELEVQARNFQGNGVRAAYAFDVSERLNVALGLSYTKVQKYTWGEIEGTGHIDSESDYSYDLYANYYYNEDYLFDRTDVDAPNGDLFALDLYTHFKFNAFITIDWLIRDVYALLQWDDVAYTQAQGSSNRKTVDKNGYVQFDPVISGYEGYESEKEVRIRHKSFLDAYVKVTPYMQLLGRYHYLYTEDMFGLGSVFHYGPAHAMATYWPKQHTWEFEMAYAPYISIGVASDSFSEIEESRHLLINLAFKIPF